MAWTHTGGRVSEIPTLVSEEEMRGRTEGSQPALRAGQSLQPAHPTWGTSGSDLGSGPWDTMNSGERGGRAPQRDEGFSRGV